MKKSLYILTIFIIAICLSGCVKYNANMEIKKDKSMDFSIIYAMDTQYFGDQEVLTEENRKELEEEGFKVTDYQEDTMKGFTLTKSIKNIDELSTTENTDYSLSNIEEDKDKEMFKVEKGFFKNKYIANFKFDTEDSAITEEGTNGGTITDGYSDGTIEENPDSYSDFPMDSTEGYNDSSMDDFSNMATSNLDLSLNVTLPYQAISNNATKTENDNKTLSWDLTSSEIETINFEFELYNMTNIYLTIGGIALLIIIIIVVTVTKHKKRKNIGKEMKDLSQNNQPTPPTTPSNTQTITLPTNNSQTSMQEIPNMNLNQQNNTTYGFNNIPQPIEQNTNVQPINTFNNLQQPVNQNIEPTPQPNVSPVENNIQPQTPPIDPSNNINNQNIQQ